MELINPQNDIRSFFDSEDFVIQTCQQIAKDLAGMIDFQPDLDLDMNGNVLDQLQSKVAFILKSMPSSNLQQFIYRVDIKESIFTNAVAQNDDLMQLAFETIKREAQKVYLRARFA